MKVQRVPKYTNENSNPSKPIKAQQNMNNNPLHDSTNMVSNLLSKNPLLDTPSSVKDMPRDQLPCEAPLKPTIIEQCTEQTSGAKKRGVLQPLPIPGPSNPQSLLGSVASKYSTPNKTQSDIQTTQGKNGRGGQVGPQSKRSRKPYDEDLVNFDQSPGKRVGSRGRTPRGAQDKALNSGLSSAKKSDVGDDCALNITPRSKLNQMRLDRRADTQDDYEKCDLKLKEVEQELKNIQIQPNLNTCAQMAKTSTQMKESLIRMRSAGGQGPTKNTAPTKLPAPMMGCWVNQEAVPLKPVHVPPLAIPAVPLDLGKASKLPLNPPIALPALLPESHAAAPSGKHHVIEQPLHGLKNENMMQMMATQETVCEKETEEIKAKIEEEEAKLTLEQRLVCKTWQVRRKAYKEIAEKFDAAAKEKMQESDKENVKPGGGDGKLGESQSGSVFGTYFSWLKYMLSDINLNSLHQGLCTILIYTITAPNMTPALGLLPDLLDKMPLFKPQFQDIVTKIIHEFVKRDHAQEVMNELLSRITSHKSVKVTQFCINTITGMISTSLYEEIDLKQVYNVAMQGLNSQNQRESRIPLMKLLGGIYEIVTDSLASFLGQAPKSMKAALIKELTESLKAVKKKTLSEAITLFSEAAALNPEASSQVSKQPLQSKNPREAQKAGGAPKKASAPSSSEVESDAPQPEKNMYEYIPEEIFKVMYLTKSEEKKAIVEKVNAALEKLIKMKARIEKKDHSGLINVLCGLDDGNLFVQLEVLKAFQNLCILLGKNIGNNKGKLIVKAITEKYKENKTGLMIQLEHTFNSLITKEAITLDQFIEVVMLKVSTTKNSRIRQMCLQLLSNKLCSTSQDHPDIKASFVASAAKLFPTHIAQKLITVIQKDSNAGVRDAGINLLTKLKICCPSNQIIDAIIAKLPKARIQAIYAEVREETQKTPRSQIEKPEIAHELRRSKSEMSIAPAAAIAIKSVQEPETAIKQETREEDDPAEKAHIGNKQSEEDILALVPTDYKPTIRALYKLAESDSLADFVRELQQIKDGIKNACRGEILFCIIYSLTARDRNLLTIAQQLPSEVALQYNTEIESLINIAIRPLSEPELSCAISCSMILAYVLKDNTQQSPYQNLNHLHQVSDAELFAVTLQKVLYTFKYSTETETSGMQQGMTAYKILCDWLQSSEMIEELAAKGNGQKMVELLNLDSGVGFAEEFLQELKTCKNAILDKLGKKQVFDAIANASAVIQNLKVPTPRSQHKSIMSPKRMSKNHQQIIGILELLKQKEAGRIKKGLEQLCALVESVLAQNSSGQGNSSFTREPFLAIIRSFVC